MPTRFDDINRGQFAGAGTGAGPALIKPLSSAQSGAVDPREFINTNLAQLRDDFKQRTDTLKASGLDVSVHNRILAGWQDEYDQTKGQLTGVTSQFDLIQQSVGAGSMTPEAGREAAIRMIVPRETADLMFPSVRSRQRGRFTPGEFGAYVKEFEDRIELAEVDPWGFIRKSKRKYVDPDILKEQYFSARAAFAYNTDMNTDEQKGFDLAWDQAIANDKKAATAWKKAMKEDPDLFTSRTYDARLLNIAANKARGSISPLGKALRPKTFVSAAIRKVTTPWAPSQFFQTGEQPEADIEPKKQVNQRTGQTRISYDGGRTWQIE